MFRMRGCNREGVKGQYIIILCLEGEILEVRVLSFGSLPRRIRSTEESVEHY